MAPADDVCGDTDGVLPSPLGEPQLPLLLGAARESGSLQGDEEFALADAALGPRVELDGHVQDASLAPAARAGNEAGNEDGDEPATSCPLAAFISKITTRIEETVLGAPEVQQAQTAV